MRQQRKQIKYTSSFVPFNDARGSVAFGRQPHLFFIATSTLEVLARIIGVFSQTPTPVSVLPAGR
jgi:hypothetical protein